MAMRRHMSGGKHRKTFQKARNRRKAINTGSMMARGGIRL